MRPPPAPSLALVAALAAACAFPPTPIELLLPEPELADPALRDACAVTATKCTTCHTLERVVVLRVASPRDWRPVVERMRLMRSSGISVADADVILHCLVVRSFGPHGLSELDPSTPGAP